MVFTTYLWWFGGWFSIVWTTLLDKCQVDTDLGNPKCRYFSPLLGIQISSMSSAWSLFYDLNIDAHVWMFAGLGDVPMSQWPFWAADKNPMGIPMFREKPSDENTCAMVIHPWWKSLEFLYKFTLKDWWSSLNMGMPHESKSWQWHKTHGIISDALDEASPKTSNSQRTLSSCTPQLMAGSSC